MIGAGVADIVPFHLAFHIVQYDFDWWGGTVLATTAQSSIDAEGQHCISWAVCRGFPGCDTV